MLTTRPQPALIMAGTRARAIRNGAVASSSMIRSHSASVVFSSEALSAVSGGLVTLPVWVIYLWLVVREFRATRALPATTA